MIKTASRRIILMCKQADSAYLYLLVELLRGARQYEELLIAAEHVHDATHWQAY